jgi:hypothetical protein
LIEIWLDKPGAGRHAVLRLATDRLARGDHGELAAWRAVA